MTSLPTTENKKISSKVEEVKRSVSFAPSSLNEEEDKEQALKTMVHWIKVANKRGAFSLMESHSIYLQVKVAETSQITSEELSKTIGYLIEVLCAANKRGIFELDESYLVANACLTFKKV